MKKFMGFLLVLALVCFLGGCATLSEDECLQADWYQIGHTDGTLEKPPAVFQKHIEACQKHGVTADSRAYYAGRNDGLKTYCTEATGFEQGKMGRSYKHVCPPAMEPAFMTGYMQGRKIYEFNKKVAAVKHKMADIEAAIRSKEEQLYSHQLTREDRAIIRAEIRSLDIEYRDLARELRYLEEENPSLSMR